MHTCTSISQVHIYVCMCMCMCICALNSMSITNIIVFKSMYINIHTSVMYMISYILYTYDIYIFVCLCMQNMYIRYECAYTFLLWCTHTYSCMSICL